MRRNERRTAAPSLPRSSWRQQKWPDRVGCEEEWCFDGVTLYRWGGPSSPDFVCARGKVQYCYGTVLSVDLTRLGFSFAASSRMLYMQGRGPREAKVFI